MDSRPRCSDLQHKNRATMDDAVQAAPEICKANKCNVPKYPIQTSDLNASEHAVQVNVCVYVCVACDGGGTVSSEPVKMERLYNKWV